MFNLGKTVLDYKQAIFWGSRGRPPPKHFGSVMSGNELEAAVSLLVREGRFAEARACLEEAVRQSPRSAQAHALLACFHHLQKRTPEALAEYRLAVFLEPENCRYLYSLAALLYASAQYAEAKKFVRELLRKEPDHPEGKAMSERLAAHGWSLI